MASNPLRSGNFGQGAYARPMDFADLEGTGGEIVALPESRGGDPKKARIRELETQVTSLQLQIDREKARHEQDLRRHADDAYQKGLRDGTAAGESMGKAIAQAASDARLSEIELSVRSRIEVVENRLDAAVLDWDSRVAELAMAVARRIVGEVCELPGAAAVHVARMALKKLGAEFRVVMRCHPDDITSLERERELWNGRGANRRVELVEDDSIGRGGVVVETDTGTIDARIPRLTESVERALARAIEAEGGDDDLP